MFSRGNRIQRWRKHGNCVSSQMITKEQEYVAVMSVGLPGVVLWHIVCPKPCCARPEASHFTRLWPGIINRHLACCPKNLTVVLLRSARSWQNGCSSCIGSNGVRLAIPCTLTHRPFLFSQLSRASSQGFFSCPPVPYRDSVSVLSVSGVLRSYAEGDPRMYFVLSRAVASSTVDCTFVRTDAWLDFSRDLVSLWPKTRQL